MSATQLELYLQETERHRKHDTMRKHPRRRKLAMRWLNDVYTARWDDLLRRSSASLMSLQHDIYGYKLFIISYIIHANYLEFSFKLHATRKVDHPRSQSLLRIFGILGGLVILLSYINYSYALHCFKIISLSLTSVTTLSFLIAYQLNSCLCLMTSLKLNTQRIISFIEQSQGLYLGKHTWNAQSYDYVGSEGVESTHYESIEMIKKALFQQLRLLSEDLCVLDINIHAELSLHNQINELGKINRLVFASAMDLMVVLVSNDSLYSMLTTPSQLISIYTRLRAYHIFTQNLCSKYLPNLNQATSNEVDHFPTSNAYIQSFSDLRRQLISIQRKQATNTLLLRNLHSLLSSPEFMVHVLEGNNLQVQQMLSSSTIFMNVSSDDKPYAMLMNQLNLADDLEILIGLLKKFSNPSPQSQPSEQVIDAAIIQKVTIVDEHGIAAANEQSSKQEYIDGIDSYAMPASVNSTAAANDELGRHVDVYTAVVRNDHSLHAANAANHQNENGRIEEKRRNEQLLHELKVTLLYRIHDTVEHIRRLPGDSQEADIDVDSMAENDNDLEYEDGKSIMEGVLLYPSVNSGRIASLQDLQNQLTSAIRTRSEMNDEDVYD
jgi:hypothetical protein